MHRTLLALLVVCLVSACSHTPTLESNPETESLRAQYLRENPNGVYNENIMRGEVVKGMNFVEVLASWGVPTQREQRNSGRSEVWSYRALDKSTSEFVLYDLVFDERVVKEWAVDRYTAGAGVSTMTLSDQARTRDAKMPSPTSQPFGGSGKSNF